MLEEDITSVTSTSESPVTCNCFFIVNHVQHEKTSKQNHVHNSFWLCYFSYFLKKCMLYVFLFSGYYGKDVDLNKLKDFHRRRLQVLVESGPDLLAFETIPNKLETQVTTHSLFLTLS